MELLGKPPRSKILPRKLQYVEKIELGDFLSLADDNPARTAAGWSTEEARLNLKLRSQEVKLKMESLESREMWKGFILTVVEMKVPPSLMLLPGHLYMLAEALEKEKQRRSNLEQSDPQKEKELPECFFRVSRTEAEVLLEKNESCGNMLLRPGGDGKSIAVTTRQKVNGTAAIKHYKINVDCGEYVIDVEEPYRCSSLQEVVEFFVTNTNRVLVPLSLDESYAMTLEIMEMDKESGESTSVPARVPLLPPHHPKGAPGGQKPSPSPRSRPFPPLPPPVLPIQSPRPVSVPPPESVYLEEDPPDQTYVNDEHVAEMKQINSPGAPGLLRGGPSVPKTTERTSSRLIMSLPRGFSIGMSEELERKLQERRATIQE
ncbi:signal-transducing adaptor protein 2 [Sceloporus undulatus]|uniref:signal-transducing adaptor protein 2 n=1 Tax=Sceloporus undulatus TaxID=8520 RepID=UPI001C4B2C73|nr:signal-transducing adaptor protein 2 [Sceloporus undulatus]